MKKIVDIITELASALSNFGECQESTDLINDAICANNWFTKEEICRSIEAISHEMLDRDKFQQWLQSYPLHPQESQQKRIAIIMAGNIPLVGFADLLATLAAGHQAWIKPSSKDRVLMLYICELLKKIEPNIPIYIYDDSLSYDAIIATGGSDANLYFNKRFKDSKRLCRSNRHSIAVLSSQNTPRQMELLAEDIYLYSGLGCRNVAMIFIPNGMKIEVPHYNTNHKYHNNYTQTKALLSITGRQFEDNGSSVFIRSMQLPSTLSTISLWEYDTIDQVNEWISQHEDEIQCIVSQCIEHPRCVDFGKAQHPSLSDYADGVDTMKFLEFND